MEKETKFENVPIEKLVPYAGNARTHDDTQVAKIAASIKEFGFLNPVIISDDNTILCGHGRYYAAQKLGLKELPCVRESYLTEAQRKAYVIADNRLALDAGWDKEMLAAEMQELSDAGFDTSVVGFNDREMSSIRDTMRKGEDDDFDIEKAEAEENHIAKDGDIWTLGDHKIFCGDATEPESYEKLMGGDGSRFNTYRPTI